MEPNFVVDSSIALAWCFQDEATPATRALLHRMGGETAVVPAWWFLELTNVLALAERKRRITPVKVAEFIALIEGFDLEIDEEGSRRSFTHLLPLCRSHHLTSYDALYLDLRSPPDSIGDVGRTAAKSRGKAWSQVTRR